MPSCPSDCGRTAGEGSEQEAENAGAPSPPRALLRTGQADYRSWVSSSCYFWHSLDFLPQPCIAFMLQNKKTTGIFKKPWQ